jgi:DNA-binding transcriptional LysR family regulator
MIDKLEMLIALSREQHFGHAAAACGVSQPALSTAIKQLEGSFGVELVQRGARFKGFTPEGERVLDWARRIVGDTRVMYQEIEALKHGLFGHIRIGVIPTALPLVATLTKRYLADHPNVRFAIFSQSSDAILNGLTNLELDAGLTYLENEPLGQVLTVRLYEEEYRLLVSSDSPFGKLKKISWAELGRVPLCLLTADMQNRRILDRLLHRAKAEVIPTLETNSPTVLYTHVGSGGLATIMPAKAAAAMRFPSQVREIPIINPAVKYAVGLVVPKREPLPPPIEILVRDAKKFFSKKR